MGAVLAGCAMLSQSPTSPREGAVANASTHAAYRGLDDLYIADYGNGRIDILRHLKPHGRITDGINGPQDVTLDASGNLYVVNTTGDNITEYAPGASAPAFVYNAGMTFPATVAVDRSGHVYEVDQETRHGSSVVNEYAQESNTMMYSCPVTGKVVGVALDPAENVFISYITADGGGRIAEYEGGIAAGCTLVVQSVHIDAPGGLVIDDNDNIVLSDQRADEVQIIPPPYRKVVKNIRARFQDPYHISINQANTKIYVTDVLKSRLFILDYPSGKTAHVLRLIAFGAAKGPNEVH
jgi:DNA-binding beta-propeller fold protein YncE